MSHGRRGERARPAFQEAHHKENLRAAIVERRVQCVSACVCVCERTRVCASRGDTPNFNVNAIHRLFEAGVWFQSAGTTLRSKTF